MNTLYNFGIFIKNSFPSFYKKAHNLWLKTPFYSWKEKKYKDEIRIIFNKYSSDVFEEFFKAMDESGVTYWLACGTLLGAIREHGFIKGDMDMDVGVWIDSDFEHMDQILNQHGFTQSRRIDVYSKTGSVGFEMTYSSKGVGVDVFVFHKLDNNYIYMHDFSDSITVGRYVMFEKARRVVVPFEGLMDYEFLGHKVKIPINYDTYIAAHYGKDYMTPNPNWGEWSSPALQVEEGAFGMIKSN